MPVQHANLIDQVPAIGMQFANDLDVLALKLSEIVKNGIDWSEARKLDVNRTWEALASLARSQRLRQIVSVALTRFSSDDVDLQQTQRAAVDELLDSISLAELQSLQAQSEADRTAKQVVHMLVRLAKVWRPVMPASRFYATLGQLVNNILEKLLKSVENMEDIGEEDSKRINIVCRVFTGLEAGFDGVGADHILLKPVLQLTTVICRPSRALMVQVCLLI